MQAIECDAVVHDGCITVPANLEGRRVRLLVLADNDADAKGSQDRQAALLRALAQRDTVPGFVPMTRDEANQR